MHLAAVWRSPVKSMQPESRDEAHLAPGGADGDRGFGVLDQGSGAILSAKHDARRGGGRKKRTTTAGSPMTAAEILCHAWQVTLVDRQWAHNHHLRARAPGVRAQR
jgi:uncharacterized protein YcbX